MKDRADEAWRGGWPGGKIRPNHAQSEKIKGKLEVGEGGANFLWKLARKETYSERLPKKFFSLSKSSEEISTNLTPDR